MGSDTGTSQVLLSLADNRRQFPLFWPSPGLVDRSRKNTKINGAKRDEWAPCCQASDTLQGLADRTSPRPRQSSTEQTPDTVRAIVIHTLQALTIIMGPPRFREPAKHPIHVHPVRPLYRFAATGLGASMWFFVRISNQ
ncbi:unnamed protein product [Periconia digitata]|uniref:Uncharacterized protein n=1 Tax=Periconia digitata TaxID=1303443 RepID=A0A9W4XIS2_9PLEO|nr:unnamed protein product [Periconia digitata]